MSDFTGVFSAIRASTSRRTATPATATSRTAPLLFRSGYLGAQPFCSQSPSQAGCLQDAPSYPIVSNVNTAASTCSIRTSRCRTRTTTRSASSAGSPERWRSKCGTSAHAASELWSSTNFNEANIIENGFLNEFKLAQANLKANVASGAGATFAYTGRHGHEPTADLSGVLQGSAGW